MWSALGRRAVQLGVGFFALLGFVAVPLGKRTGYEHAKAIAAAAPVVDAARELVEAASRLLSRHEPAGPTPPTSPARPQEHLTRRQAAR